MKILVITSRVPWPLEKGDKLRIYHQIKQLSANNEIILCCLNDQKLHPEAASQLKKFCSELHVFQLNRLKIFMRLGIALLSQKPFQVHYFYQRSIHKKIKDLIQNSKPDHIYCQLIRTTEYVKENFEISKTLDYMDAFSKGTQRRIKKAGVIEKILLKEEQKRLLRYESLIFDYFDHHSIISSQDRDCIRHSKKDNIAVIPNGIDKNYFSRTKCELQTDVVFTGNMNYPPNRDSAIYIVKEIMPIIWKERPETTVMIAGVNNSPQVKALESDKVKITGWMEDIRDAYASSRVFLAPMMLGSGLQNKLLEAMSMEMPCVTSVLANNALQAKEDEEVLIGRQPQDYAEKVLQLLENSEKAERMGIKGKNFVHFNYDWKSSTEKLHGLMLKK